MSWHWCSSHAALALASTVTLAACSSDAPTAQTTPSQSLTAAAPTISVQAPYFLRSLCYPPRFYSVRGCPSGASVAINNSRAGTLNWTTSKSAAWIRRSPFSGTAPSTMNVWVDGRGLPPGTYSGYITISAAGATNSPYRLSVGFTNSRSPCGQSCLRRELKGARVISQF